MINIKRGITNAIFLLLKFSPPKSAIAVSGEKLGGWGITLEIIPKIIRISTSFWDLSKFKFILVY